MMTGCDGGNEEHDGTYEEFLQEEASERAMEAVRDEYELALIEQALTELYRERGAKTGAVNKQRRHARAEMMQSLAVPERPAFRRKW